MSGPALALAEPADAADWALARRLIEAYCRGLPVDLGFQDVDHELAHLPAAYGPPAGALLIARRAGEPLGCVALRPLADGVAELKRLYVLETARGAGVGRALVTAMLARARARGYRRVRLDTLASMAAAQALYRELGFRPIAAYRHNPLPGTAYFELEL
jgi:ribosomal protein S18 acetylase RimI-like enzyme